MVVIARPSDWGEHRSREANLSVDTVRVEPDAADVAVRGELDLATAAPLWAMLRGHLAAGRRFVRLDVSGLTFVDTTALTGLTSVHHDLLAQRGTLVLTGVKPPVARLLRSTGLDGVLLVSGQGIPDIVPPVMGPPFLV